MNRNDPPNDRLLPLKLAVTRARIAATERRDSLVASGGAALGHAGRRAVLWLHRRETIDLPAPIEVGGHQFDVAADLADYTGLGNREVRGLLERRSDSFRAEWFLASPEHRADQWFYLSSSTYLFGNAVHDPTPLVNLLLAYLTEDGRALDFGGGSGNLALALAASGWRVDYLEQSALQKDFVRFRVWKHGLTDEVRVLDPWGGLERQVYDLVTAIDVLEHVDDLRKVLTATLLPSIQIGGVLAESSPFTRNLSNPMHHFDPGLDSMLVGDNFELELTDPLCRIWRRSTDSLGFDHSD